MKTLLLSTLLLIVLIFTSVAQTVAPSSEMKKNQDNPTGTSTEKKTPAFGIAFSGYVKTDIFFDTRQTNGLRDGHFLLFPECPKPDADGNDINAKSAYNILSIQTRLAGTIWGPDAIGAKTSAYIEAEFFGNINPNINSFRLRHAWVKLNWPRTELLVGQWWHPMFVPECAPATVSFNTGAPFVVFSRNPQIKITQHIGKFSIALTMLSQVDFMSDGPEGTNTKYIRNSVIPESDLQFQFFTMNAAKGIEFLCGFGINWQRLLPRLSSTVIITPASDSVKNGIVVHHDAVTATYKTDAYSSAMAYNAYAKLRLKKVTFKMGGEYGGNNNAYTMLGGYVVKSVTDTTRGFVNYSNIRSFAAWAEFHTNAIRWQPGLFIAYGKNLGAGEAVKGPYYARGSNIDYAYRISPRLIFNANKFRLAGELEYTVAAYGTINEKGFVSAPTEVGNLRILLGVYYFF
ncbi:MAG: hypothetical protein NTY96_13425 [Bacteroidetes bacterium]|nr:hypothetical protein [Bacteroidota bacterium]